MSLRVHVIGAYGATETELRAALDAIGGDGSGSARFRSGSSGPWAWANASVWQVDGAAIDQALGALSVPSLRATSSDGVLWTLTLMQPGKDLFRGVHHFTAVGHAPDEFAPKANEDETFPEDEIREVAGINRDVPELEFLWDAEEAARLAAEHAEHEDQHVPGLDEYTDYGAALPAAVIEEMRSQPHRAWHTALMAHSRQLVQALQECRFDFDPAVMFDLLTIGPLTELEQASDLGNLPRFLRTLGIEGVFLDEESEASGAAEMDSQVKADPSTESWSRNPPGELFRQFDSLSAERSLTEIAGGPVEVAHAALLQLLSHLLAEDPPTQILLEYPDAAIQPSPLWHELSALEVRHTGRRWEFCFETSHWWFAVCDGEELETNGISTALGSPPEETRFELRCGVEGLAERLHCYAGTFRDGRLRLDRTSPVATAEVLHEAFSLAGRMFDSKPIELNSEAETKAVRRDYERAHGDPPRIRQGKVKPDEGCRKEVIQALLFERFSGRGPWDVAGARNLIEEEWSEYEELCQPAEETERSDDEEQAVGDPALETLLKNMKEAAERSEAAKQVPHRDEVLLTDSVGKVWKASLADLQHVSPQRLADHDAALANLGFRPVGDVTGDASRRQEITRMYAGNPEAISLLSHRMANNLMGWAPVSNGLVSVDFSDGVSEFHTRFDDGTTLVTTSVEALKSKPEVGLYVRSYEEISLAKLWEKHRDGIERFQTHRGACPIDHTQFTDLTRLLTMTHELLGRVLGTPPAS